MDDVDLDELFNVFSEEPNGALEKHSETPTSVDPVAVPQCDIK